MKLTRSDGITKKKKVWGLFATHIIYLQWMPMIILNENHFCSLWHEPRFCHIEFFLHLFIKPQYWKRNPKITRTLHWFWQTFFGQPISFTKPFSWSQKQVSEWISEPTNERSIVHECRKWCERMSKGTSEWPSTQRFNSTANLPNVNSLQ